jgi:Mn-containing catalase
MPGDPRFANTYFNMSQGPGEMRGSWNQGEKWDFVTDREKQMAVDGGSGEAEVKLPAKDIDVLKAMAERTMSNPAVDPPTGAELGMGNQTNADGATVQPGAIPSPGAPKKG